MGIHPAPRCHTARQQFTSTIWGPREKLKCSVCGSSYLYTNMCSSLPRPELTSHPVDVGHRSEAAILSALVQRGYRVLLPFGVNQRYDLVLECESRFLKAQCKTGRLRDGVIQVSTQSIQSNTRRTRTRSYAGEVDLFIVYCADNEGIYVVPADEVPAKEASVICVMA